MTTIAKKLKNDFPNCELIPVLMLSEEDYLTLYSNNYGQFGLIPLLLHDAYFGFRDLNVLIYREKGVIKGFATILNAKKNDFNFNYWVMPEYRKNGIGTQLREALKLLYRTGD